MRSHWRLPCNSDKSAALTQHLQVVCGLPYVVEEPFCGRGQCCLSQHGQRINTLLQPYCQIGLL